MVLLMLALTPLALGDEPPTREPLPGRAIERSLVIPRGWLALSGGRMLPGDWEAGLRYGVFRRTELELGWEGQDVHVGGRVALLDQEPPRRSLAMGLRLVGNLEADALAWAAGLGFRQEWSPFKADVELWQRAPFHEGGGSARAWTGVGRLTLQVGALLPSAELGSLVEQDQVIGHVGVGTALEIRRGFRVDVQVRRRQAAEGAHTTARLSSTMRLRVPSM